MLAVISPQTVASIRVSQRGMPAGTPGSVLLREIAVDDKNKP